MCNHWTITTPEFEYVDVILEDGTGPIEIVRDVINVEASTKREALVKGVREMRLRSTHQYYREG